MAKSAEKGDLTTHDAIDDRLGFMTPILKGFLTEMGTEAASTGIQLYGGHGYIKSNKQEQVYRDVRISAIWEGTTGWILFTCHPSHLLHNPSLSPLHS
jgi:alkylation response protein AidB-like acyl-CoA dehydrogenase